MTKFKSNISMYLNLISKRKTVFPKNYPYQDCLISIYE